MKLIHLSILASIFLLPTSLFAQIQNLTSKEQDENTFLIDTLLEQYKEPRKPDVDRLFAMTKFQIIQKVSDGYIICPECSTSKDEKKKSELFFLKTNKQIPVTYLVSGLVVYTGDYSYQSKTGNEIKIPTLQVQKGLPLKGYPTDKNNSKVEKF